MERAGEKLKRARERLNLTFRDVEQASQEVARLRGSEEFALALSRLADIENKGTLPSIYRIYTLCAIYRLDFDEVLRWYGVPRDHLAEDAVQIGLGSTHAFEFAAETAAANPVDAEVELNSNKTIFLSQFLRRWGRLPLALIKGAEARGQRYGFIGLEDW